MHCASVFSHLGRKHKVHCMKDKSLHIFFKSIHLQGLKNVRNSAEQFWEPQLYSLFPKGLITLTLIMLVSMLLLYIILFICNIVIFTFHGM